MKLLKEACVKFLSGLLVVGLLLFLPAGTIDYPGGWRLIGLLFVPMLIAGLIMWKKAPDLLAKRLKAKEAQGTQRAVIALSGLMFVAGFVLCGLDFRLSWTAVPCWLVWAASLVFLAGYLLFARVLTENAYLSRTIEVQQGQTVIDTGLYGIVRHPMYSATILLFLSMPLILGSWIGFAVFLLYLPVIRVRILAEEVLLKAGLSGYADYCQRIRWRLFPHIW